MSDGLLGSLVDKSFSPSCANCYHQLECAVEPKHPGFPQQWPWAKSSIPFREGLLILRSWVGSERLYIRHENCRFYMVRQKFVIPLELHHIRYLNLERQKQQVHHQLTELEEKGIENEFTRMMTHSFRGLLDMQSLISRTYAPTGSEEEQDGS